MRESTQERDLRNQCVGFDRAMSVIESEWRKREPTCNMLKGSDTTADLLWKLIEAARAVNAETDREWRRLQDKRYRASKKARKA